MQRKPRSDQGPRLTERDLLALRIIGEQYALRFDQIRLLLGIHAKAETQQEGILSESATKHAIRRWRQAGLIESKKILADMPSHHWLTTDGLYAAGLSFRQYKPSPSQLNHIYWTNQARLTFLQKQPSWEWQSERYLRAQLDQKIKSVKLPDALLYLPNSVVVAIEIELTQKNTIAIEEIVRDRTLVYNQVWYFAPKNVQSTLHTACSKLEPHYQQRIRIFSLDILQ